MSFCELQTISLCPNFSKFFEKVMYNRLAEFAETYVILYFCQFGFRKNHSTSLALIHFSHEIPSSVFLDLSKAFDTLDHEILFAKLEHYGICDVVLKWIKSYFSCRQQFVLLTSVRQRKLSSAESLKVSF